MNEIYSVLLVHVDRHAAFPALRRVPRADGGIFRFVGCAAGDADKNRAQQRTAKAIWTARNFISGSRMRRSDLVAFNHLAQFPAGNDVGDAAVLLHAANNDLGHQFAVAADQHFAVL